MRLIALTASPTHHRSFHEQEWRLLRVDSNLIQRWRKYSVSIFPDYTPLRRMSVAYLYTNDMRGWRGPSCDRYQDLRVDRIL